MKYKIYITRGSAISLIFRGLGNVFVWFHEPCLEVFERGDGDVFSLDDTLRKKLKGILYDTNCKYNFVYRSENDVKSPFGNKLIRNHDGIDFPLKLIEHYNNYEIRFEHRVFGSGEKVNYQRNTVSNIFGYDNEISDKIWKMVCDEFDGIEFDEWDKYEQQIPWWNFCRELEIEIKL